MSNNFINTDYGYVYYYLPDCLIYGLYVDPCFRGRGKATRLLKMAIAEIRAEGYDGPIKIEAIPQEKCMTKQELEAFYRKLGLKVLNNGC